LFGGPYEHKVLQTKALWRRSIMAPMDSCSPNELNPPLDTLKVPVWVLLVHPGHLVYVFGKDDETLPNFIKRKHPRKGENKN